MTGTGRLVDIVNGRHFASNFGIAARIAFRRTTMPGRNTNRREFLKTSSLAALAGASLPYWSTSAGSTALGFYAANERPVVGCIGVGDRWRGGIGPNVMPFG